MDNRYLRATVQQLRAGRKKVACRRLASALLSTSTAPSGRFGFQVEMPRLSSIVRKISVLSHVEPESIRGLAVTPAHHPSSASHSPDTRIQSRREIRNNAVLPGARQHIIETTDALGPEARHSVNSWSVCRDRLI